MGASQEARPRQPDSPEDKEDLDTRGGYGGLYKEETTLQISLIYLFREEELPILCPIADILTMALCDDAILVKGPNRRLV